MKITKITLAAALMVAVAFTSCKPKDADIQTGIEAAFKADPKAATTKVEVKEGVATISGECADEACKANCAKLAEGVKGVKPPVVNNCTVKAVVEAPASLTTSSLDAATQQKVKDGLKDMKTLTIAGFSGKGVIINGEISKEGKTKLMQMLASARVILDVASKITIK
jgi:hyperosmotically inducible periplasmic protein